MSLRVERVGPGATLQDCGRRGFMHLGVPRGGPLDPSLFERVRASLGNPRDAVAIELPWHRARFRATVPTVVSVDGQVSTLAAGEDFDVPPAASAVRYLGVRGGFDVPMALGARGTLLVAGLGGFAGRMLRAGDVIPLGTPSAEGLAPGVFVARDPTEPIAIAPCHGAPPAALRALFEGAFEVTTRVDRVGMRLRGAPPSSLPAAGRSLPLVRGAIEWTPEGELIVMGPDHPTTGGYPLLAAVLRRDQGALAQRRPGSMVRFVEGLTARG